MKNKAKTIRPNNSARTVERNNTLLSDLTRRARKRIMELGWPDGLAPTFMLLVDTAHGVRSEAILAGLEGQLNTADRALRIMLAEIVRLLKTEQERAGGTTACELVAPPVPDVSCVAPPDTVAPSTQPRFVMGIQADR